MTPEELAEIKTDLEAINGDNWRAVLWKDMSELYGTAILFDVCSGFGPEDRRISVVCDDDDKEEAFSRLNDAQFIAKAPSRISALLEEVGRLQSERDEFCQMARALVVKLGGEAAITRKMQNEAREDSDLVWFRPDPLRESITVQLRKRPAPPSIEKETNDGAS